MGTRFDMTVCARAREGYLRFIDGGRRSRSRSVALSPSHSSNQRLSREGLLQYFSSQSAFTDERTRMTKLQEATGPTVVNAQRPFYGRIRKEFRFLRGHNSALNRGANRSLLPPLSIPGREESTVERRVRAELSHIAFRRCNRRLFDF